MKYIQHYSDQIKQQVQKLIEEDKLSTYLLNKYPAAHEYSTDKALYTYATDLKNSSMKKSPPLSKVLYDGRINVLNDALGQHSFVSRVQGGKLKSKNEIKIASMFRSVPEAFLRMIVVHELAHFKEKAHNKAFYQLCMHIEPDYHQLELDLRLYLIHIERFGKLY